MAIPGTIRLPQVASKPSAPPAGYVLVYTKIDDVLYLQDSTGTEVPFGSASSITSLVGEATAAGPGTATITLTNSAVIGKVLTGFSSGPNSAVLATDTILQAIQKLQAQATSVSTSAITSLAGDVTATGPGSVTATVNSVGSSSASNIHSAELAANAATSVNTVGKIVARDGSGNFSASTITANLTGNVTGNLTGNASGSSSSFTGSLSGDVTGTQSSTSISSPTITGKLLTGYSIGANTPISSTDSILVAFEKVQGQVSTTSSSAIIGLTGDVIATGPGSVSSTIQPSVVTNAKLAQMPTNTIKGNNTGSTANPSDLTVPQVTALLNVFTQDTATTSGLQGLVPAPSLGTTIANDFLSPGGWKYVDQSKPRPNEFTLFNQTASPIGNTKNQSVTIQGNYAYVAGGGSAATMSIYDISNQAIPVLKGSINLLGSYQIAVQGNYAYVPSSGGFVLYVVNITDPSNPSVTGSVNLTATTGSLYSCVISGNYVYISTQSKGLTVVDVTNPASPTQVYQEGGTLNKSVGVAIAGTTLYTTNYQTTAPWTVRYLKTWNISSPTSPVLQNTYTLPSGAKPGNLSVYGNYAYVTDLNQNVVYIINITTPTAPVYTATLTPSGIFNVDFIGSAVSNNDNYVYIPSGANATYGGFIDMFDVTVPTSPILVATVNSGVPNSVFGGITIKNGYIYCGDYGIAPGSSGTLDVFTLPNEYSIVGNLIVSTITVKSGISYTPAVPSNWNTIPNSVQSGLDNIAAQEKTDFNSVNNNAIAFAVALG